MWIWTWAWTWTWTIYTNTPRDNESSQRVRRHFEKKRMNWEWKSHGHHVNNRQLSVISGQFKLGNIFSFALLNGVGSPSPSCSHFCSSFYKPNAISPVILSIFRVRWILFWICTEWNALHDWEWMNNNNNENNKSISSSSSSSRITINEQGGKIEKTNERTNPCIPYSNISILCWIRFVLSGPRDQFNLLHIFNLFFRYSP